ncbi:TPA: hypothetical protein N0F65_002387 [Lagenidium giganteum]|uniref:N-acetyltransferase domain-containing protein n=1 Tax=Lagenidium giganteum TaxID=4803 RepID=A0AAV2YMX1_9STRA|nr:TPA: hypothetical protein N0F65_002387 [Lagenidium giganteum]
MVLAVNSDEETIGYVLYRRNGSVGYIDKIAVAEQQRQQGVGRALLQHALAHLRAQRAESVCLYVEAERKVARHLYESAGFTIQAHRPDYYRPGRDAYVMSLTWI